MYEHNALGYWSGLTLCLTKVRSSRASCPATALIFIEILSDIFQIISGPFLQIKEVQVGKDQEKAQSERDSHSKNRGGKKTKLTIRHLYHETYRKPNEQLFSQ